MTELTLTIEGMSCQHCVMSVKKAIDAVEGVQASEVTVGTAQVSYNDTQATRDTIVKAVRDAGYRVTD